MLFGRKKNKDKKGGGPPPLPPQAGAGSPDPAKGIETHGAVFATSLLPHFWESARRDTWMLMEDPEKADGVTGFWMMASLSIPEQLRQMDMAEFGWNLFHHKGWKFAAFQLPPVVYPFDVRFCITAFGPLDENTTPDDPAWDTAPYRLFYQQASMGFMEMKEWVNGEPVSHGASEEEEFGEFVQAVTRRLDGSSIALVPNEGDMAAQMEQAMARARSEIDGVLRRYLAGEFEHFSVKAPVTDGEHTEHFWLENVRFENGQFVGTLDAPPQHVQGVQEGQQVSLAPAQISDYSAMKDGLIHGYHTTRVLLPTLPPAQAEQLRAVLAPV